MDTKETNQPVNQTASEDGGSRRGLFGGLSGRLLLLTVLFVLIGEVLIYVPSIARYRLNFLEDRLDAGHLATLAIEADPDGMLDKELEKRLLGHAMVEGVVLRQPDVSLLMLSRQMPPAVDKTFDLRESNVVDLCLEAFELLIANDRQAIRVLGASRVDPEVVVEVVLKEGYLREQMLNFSVRILTLSIVLSLITAGLVFINLQWLIVRPIVRITDNLTRFRRNPEDEQSVIEETLRSDEIGSAQRALAAMQQALRRSLLQRSRLAALGAAMSKINHDLRNSLASAMLVSDSLAQIEDPTVQRVTPRLMTAIDRAIKICSQTLDYAQTAEPKLEPKILQLHEIVEDVREAIGLPEDTEVEFDNTVPKDFTIYADRVQLFRMLLNVGRNAVDAMKEGGTLSFSAHSKGAESIVDMVDTGPGLPQKARENLFKPFAGSTRRGGTGLGLAIVRELARLHGGDIEMISTGETGTHFRLHLPAR